MTSRAPAFLVLAVLALSAHPRRSAAAEPVRPAGVLRLANDDFVGGELLDSPDPAAIRWQPTVFMAPLEFPLGSVKEVYFPAAGPRPKPAHEFCFDLLDDDAVFGTLLGVTGAGFDVAAGHLGTVQVRREQLRRFYRVAGPDAVYSGPDGLAGWKDAAKPPRWVDERGQIRTDKPESSVTADIKLPGKALVEFEVSWEHAPNFVLAVGTDLTELPVKRLGGGPQGLALAPVSRGFQFEVWDKELVAVGESGRDADVASLGPVGAGPGRAHVLAYLDQEAGRMIILSAAGNPAATLSLSPKKPRVRTGVRLTNKTGDVRLERLRITRWNGVTPPDVRDGDCRVLRTDGSVVIGRLERFDPAAKALVVLAGANRTVVTLDAVADVFFGPPAVEPTPAGKPKPSDKLAANDGPKPAGDPAAATTSPAAGREITVVYDDGARFSGTATRIESGLLVLNCPGIAAPLTLPLDRLRSLVVVKPKPAAAVRPEKAFAGRLETDGVRLHGWLADGVSTADASCFLWHPSLCRSSSPLRFGVSGRIVYRDPAPPQNLGAPNVAVVAAPQPVVPQIFTGLFGGPTPQANRPPARRLLHLRSGDTIPCAVQKIDETGITMKSPLSDATFVANDKIKAVELAAPDKPLSVNKLKRERLLTVPRSQKDSPPTHLICSTTGDYVRGRLVSMDDKTLVIEVLLEVKQLPRARVAQIIWLHPEELKPGGAAAPGVAKSIRVQAVRAGNDRLTFFAAKVAGGTVSGTSDVLGACRVELPAVQEVLLGAAIEESAAKFAYQRWRLQNAVEPKFAQAGADGGDEPPAGTESPLVGQPAPDFTLDGLNGQALKLTDRKGKVVILDFWATWCGPCMQTMPAVERLAEEFAPKGVELLALNMEERPDQIQSMLDRHKIKVKVLLDQDGVVAGKYQVTAIPQTVVIDRAGKVARVFVGGGAKTVAALKKTLQELSAGK